MFDWLHKLVKGKSVCQKRLYNIIRILHTYDQQYKSEFPDVTIHERKYANKYERMWCFSWRSSKWYAYTPKTYPFMFTKGKLCTVSPRLYIEKEVDSNESQCYISFDYDTKNKLIISGCNNLSAEDIKSLLDTIYSIFVDVEHVCKDKLSLYDLHRKHKENQALLLGEQVTKLYEKEAAS